MANRWPRFRVDKWASNQLFAVKGDRLVRLTPVTYAVLSILTESLEWDSVWYTGLPEPAHTLLVNEIKERVYDDMSTDLIDELNDLTAAVQGIADIIGSQNPYIGQISGCCTIQPSPSDSFTEVGQGTVPQPIADNYGNTWGDFTAYMCQAAQGLTDGIIVAIGQTEELITLGGLSLDTLGALVGAGGALLGVAVASPFGILVSLLAALIAAAVNEVFEDLANELGDIKQDIVCAFVAAPNASASLAAVDGIIDAHPTWSFVQKQLVKAYYHPGVHAALFNGEDEEGNPVNATQYDPAYCNACPSPSGYVPLVVALDWSTPPEWSITGDTDRINANNERSDSTNMCGGSTNTQWCENLGCVTSGPASSPTLIAQQFTPAQSGTLAMSWRFMRTSGTGTTDLKVRVLDSAQQVIFVYDKPVSGQPQNQVDLWSDSVAVTGGQQYTIELSGSRWAFADDGTAVV